MKTLSVRPPAVFYRETVMCGTSLEASGMKWLSSFPRPRSLHTNAIPSAASSAPIPREWTFFSHLPLISPPKIRLDILHSSSLPGCWPPARQTRRVRSGGRPISHWWRSSASRAIIREKHPEAGCGTAPSPETRSILLQVHTAAHSNTRSLNWIRVVKVKHCSLSEGCRFEMWLFLR